MTEAGTLKQKAFIVFLARGFDTRESVGLNKLLARPSGGRIALLILLFRLHNEKAEQAGDALTLAEPSKKAPVNVLKKEGGVMYYKTVLPSPVGVITLASDGDHLVGLWIEGQKYHGNPITEPLVTNDGIPVFNTVKRWLDMYFSGQKPSASELPLAPIGSEFRQKVWHMLRQIPYGEVITYGEIAEKLAVAMGRKSMSSQAVGGAVGHNPISIIIPCHRVVGSNGSLTGFAAGVKTKRTLLQLEGVDMSGLFLPVKGTAL